MKDVKSLHRFVKYLRKQFCTREARSSERRIHTYQITQPLPIQRSPTWDSRRKEHPRAHTRWNLRPKRFAEKPMQEVQNLDFRLSGIATTPRGTFHTPARTESYKCWRPHRTGRRKTKCRTTSSAKSDHDYRHARLPRQQPDKTEQTSKYIHQSLRIHSRNRGRDR